MLHTAKQSGFIPPCHVQLGRKLRSYRVLLSLFVLIWGRVNREGELEERQHIYHQYVLKWMRYRKKRFVISKPSTYSLLLIWFDAVLMFFNYFLQHLPEDPGAVTSMLGKAVPLGVTPRFSRQLNVPKSPCRILWYDGKTKAHTQRLISKEGWAHQLTSWFMCFTMEDGWLHRFTWRTLLKNVWFFSAAAAAALSWITKDNL